MRELQICNKDEGQRINKYLQKYLNQASSSFIYKMLRKKNIVLNDKKCSGNEILKCKDVIKLYLSEDTINKFRDKTSYETSNETVLPNALSDYKLKILYEDDDILAVHKPVNLLSQKATKKDISINDYIIDYYNRGERDINATFKPSICNRLDRNTSGIILAGLSLKGSRYLSECLRNRTIDKYYFAIVKGCIKAVVDYKGYISKDSENNKSEVISDEQFKLLPVKEKNKYHTIETIIYPIDNNGQYSLVKLKLVTGKSHQLRANLLALGYPIIGDTKYGDVITNKYFRDKYKLKNQLLHSGELIFSKQLIIKDELPEQFVNICKGLGLNYSQC